ncbi:MAG: restriction endonuclease subunit S [Pyramidobacter sp.]|nr:restriction endonuclease subunit S [Pyramidobacter sp.]
MSRAKNKKDLTPEEKRAQALVPPEEQPYEVPENWRWVRVGAISSLHRGVSYKKSEEHKTCLPNDCLILRGGNVKEGYIEFGQDDIFVDRSLVSDEQIVRKNDVIIVASTGSAKVIGRTGISITNYTDVAFGAFLMLLRPCNQSDPRYLGYFFQSSEYRNRIKILASGVNINNIRADYITDTPCPLPPLSEQNRIVDRIERLFAALDTAKEKAQAVLASCEARKAAILHKAFSGELTEKWRKNSQIDLHTWQRKTLSSITVNYDHKRVPLSKEQRKNLDRKYDYYGASGAIDKVDRYLFDGKYLLIGEDGANLVTRSKPIAFIAEGKYWVNNHAHILDVNNEIVMEFLCHYINSISLLPYVTGSAQPKMTQAKMNEIPIPIPTYEEQQEIVRQMEMAITCEAQISVAVENVLTQITALKQSILARAFRGELGTNDPAEPATEL